MYHGVRQTKREITMHTILGAGGPISNELVKILASRGKQIRLVGRNPKPDGAAELRSADISNLDQTVDAVAGSKIVYLLIGLKYDRKIWRELWPKIMRNTIEACKRAGAKLIFFDNVYMYGKVAGPMTEGTPFNPCSEKGQIRAEVATTLLNEIKSGNLTAMFARAADFYGPDARTGVPNVLIFNKFALGSRANWLASDSKRHSLTYVPDAALALAMLADHEPAWNQTWHMPTRDNPPTGRELIESIAQAMGVRPRYFVLRKPVLKIAGLFDTTVRELYEMLYQYDSEYLFDSTKFQKAFGFEATGYSAGIHATTMGTGNKTRGD
jgi:nucleoside-diphosphate-sugar epimerase